MNHVEKRDHLVFSGENASGRDIGGSSLIPMLIAGLVLITVGAVAVMAFV
jgi:hypothetical protein